MKNFAYFLIIFIAYSCYSMEESTVQPITHQKELEDILELGRKAYYAIFLTLEEQVLLDDYLSTKFQKLLAIPGRQDAFFIKNKEKVSFIASHQDEKKDTRVILDGVFLNLKKEEKPNLEIIPVMLGYLCTKYPAATEFWTAILKKNEPGSKLFISQGFIQSKYMDALHNTDIFQGWKRKIQK